MGGKPIIAGLVIIVIVAVVVGVIIGVGGGSDDDGANGGQVKVPINLEGANNIGSISIELVYDSDVLEATEVVAGELAANAMIESNIQNPGRVIIGIIDSSGINGDGAIATVSFNQVGDGGTSPLTLENVETHDATTLVDIINETSDGSFAAEGNAVTAPVITIGP